MSDLKRLEQEFELADRLIGAGLMNEIEPAFFQEKAPQGAILCSCGDCHRFPSIFEYSRKDIQNIHSVASPGGAILFGSHYFEKEVSFRQIDILRAMAAQKMNFVFMSSHFPCGLATAYGISLRQSLLDTLTGKRRLKMELPTLRQTIPIGLDSHQVPIEQIPKLTGCLAITAIDWSKTKFEERGIVRYAIRWQDFEAIQEFELAVAA